jgi:heterodisulfide reductase subunit A-like polyferredoxin
MAMRHYSLQIEEDDLERLKIRAEYHKIKPSALARILISEGLSRYGMQIVHLQETVDYLVQLMNSNTELSAAAVAASSLLSSKGLERKAGESAEDYKTRYYADLKENIKTSRKLGTQIQRSFSQQDG